MKMWGLFEGTEADPVDQISEETLEEALVAFLAHDGTVVEQDESIAVIVDDDGNRYTVKEIPGGSPSQNS